MQYASRQGFHTWSANYFLYICVVKGVRKYSFKMSSITTHDEKGFSSFMFVMCFTLLIVLCRNP